MYGMNMIKFSIWQGKIYAERFGQVVATIDHVMTPGIPESNSFLVMVRESSRVEAVSEGLDSLWNGAARFKTLEDAMEYVESLHA